MKPFEQLTKRGKGIRLFPLASYALSQYDLQIHDLRLVGVFTNTLYRAFAAGGPSYLVRVCTPGWRTTQDLLSEIAWLQDLNEDMEVGAPVPVPARSGEYLVEASAAGVPVPHRVMVMSWIPGVLLARRLNEANLEKMGALFARLHASSARFTPPPSFTRRKMDWIYARGEEDALFGESCRDAFTPENRRVYEEVERRVRLAFSELYADPLGLRVIHNDLHHENIKIYRGRLHPLDFEDTIWGYPVQDVAMAFQDLWTEVEPQDYERLTAAFQRGYERLSPWPEQYPGQIDIFRAGRMLWVSNYVARFERPYLKGFIERVAGRFSGFLQTGIIRKQ